MSSIAQEFTGLLDHKPVCDRLAELPLDLDQYLICSGYLAGMALLNITPKQYETTWRVNFIEPARFCDRLFAVNDTARVCLIGSESGFRGSYDMAYAGSKAALHLYVETKQLRTPQQRLVGIAPTIISDSGMTRRRTDHKALEARAAATRHGRWLTAREVAELALTALTALTPFWSNTVIRLREDRP